MKSTSWAGLGWLVLKVSSTLDQTTSTSWVGLGWLVLEGSSNLDQSISVSWVGLVDLGGLFQPASPNPNLPSRLLRGALPEAPPLPGGFPGVTRCPPVSPVPGVPAARVRQVQGLPEHGQVWGQRAQQAGVSAAEVRGPVPGPKPALLVPKPAAPGPKPPSLSPNPAVPVPCPSR